MVHRETTNNTKVEAKKQFLTYLIVCKWRSCYYMNMNSYSCCTPQSDESKNITALVPLLKLVAEENRLKLLCTLRKGSHCVCEMIEHLHLSQSLVSHHLRDLKQAGIVRDEKKGLRVYYSLTKKGERIINSLFAL